jgi:hypothetical protein
VDYSIGCRRAAAKAFEIFERSAMRLGARGSKAFRIFFRARKAEYAMTSID